MRISIFISVVCAQVAFGAWAQDKFVIGSYWDPPYSTDQTADLQKLQQFKDAGFNTLSGLAARVNGTPLSILDKRQRWRNAFQIGGIQMFSSDQINNPNNNSAVEAAWVSALSPARFADPSSYNCAGCRNIMAGYHVWDEPSQNDPVPLNRAIALQSLDPDVAAWINLFPNLPWVGAVSDFGQHLSTYLAAGLKLISMDHYQYWGGASGVQILGNYYSDYKMYADSTKKYGAAFWGFALSHQHAGYAPITKPQLQVSAFTNILYGAKGVFYFTYEPKLQTDAGTMVPSIINVDGTPNLNSVRPIYTWTQSINKYLSRIGPTIMSWKWISTIHGSGSDIQPNFFGGFETNLSVITSSTPILQNNLGSQGQYFAVGIFSGKAAGESFLAILNKDINVGRTVSLSLKTPARAYLTSANMDSWIRRGKVSALSLALQPGEMQVVRLTTQSVSGNNIHLR